MKNSSFCGNDFSFPLGKKTYIMGILNVTPDSFSDGGKYFSPQKALSRAVEIEKEGADIIDIGAMSTRPGSERISVKEEIERLSCLPEIVSSIGIPVSVDTFNCETAVFALEHGASVINDVSGVFNREMAEVVKQYNCGYIVMHAPNQRAEINADYPHGVVKSVESFFDFMMSKLTDFGIADDRICLDPGFGFSKNTADNIDLLRNLSSLKRDVCLLTALSRKRFIGDVTEVAESDMRIFGSSAAGVIAVEQGTDMLRVHDVRAAVESSRIADRVYRSKN